MAHTRGSIVRQSVTVQNGSSLSEQDYSAVLLETLAWTITWFYSDRPYHPLGCHRTGHKVGDFRIAGDNSFRTRNSARCTSTSHLLHQIKKSSLVFGRYFNYSQQCIVFRTRRTIPLEPVSYFNRWHVPITILQQNRLSASRKLFFRDVVVAILSLRIRMCYS